MQELGELSLSLIPSCRTLPGQPPIPPISEPADHVSLTWHIYHTRKKEKKALCLNFHEISGCWAIHTWAIATPMDRHLRQIALIITRRLRLRIRMPKVSIRIYSLDTLAPNSAFALDPDVLHVSALFFIGALLALPCNMM